MTQQRPPRPTPPPYKPPPQWVEDWPCVCNRGDRVWHKHYADGHHNCARCPDCRGYRPDIPEQEAIRILLGPVMSKEEAATILMGPSDRTKNTLPQSRQFVLDLLDKPDTRVTLMRGIKDVTPPSDDWAKYEVSKTLYVIISSGPIDAHVENSIRAALGHDPMSFVK